MNLVVGGCGYIGSGLVQKLIDSDKDTIVVDNLSTGHKDTIKTKFYQIDIKDNLDFIFEENKIDNVFHLAERSSVKESMINPRLYLEENIKGSINLIKTCEKFNIKNFVYSSSAAVYGLGRYGFKEDSPKEPINPYGEAKSFVEEYLKYSKLNYYCMRYFNAAGADVNLRYGERHNPETHLIPVVINNILNDIPVEINGNDYHTLDGTCIRDYIHIDDINDAHMKIIGNESGCYNIGSGTGYSIRQIVERIISKTNKNPKIIIKDKREGDPPVLIADTSKINQIYIEPKYKLDKIIDTAIKYQQKTLQNKTIQ